MRRTTGVRRSGPWLVGLLCLLCVGCVQSAFDRYCQRHGGCPDGGIPPHTGYYVLGNTLYDSADQPHLFRGVLRPSLERRPDGESLSLDDYRRIASWGANVVLLPLSQDFWLSGAALQSPAYPTTVDQNVAWAHDAGMDVILELTTSDRGLLSAASTDRQAMADINSVQFWSEVAARYRGDSRVLFSLYAEPHDVTWDVWRSGGALPTDGGFLAAGMQQLYDAIRGTGGADGGADSVVLVSGLASGFDLSGVPTHRLNGYNIAYASHLLTRTGEEPAGWDGGFGFLADTDPVVVTSLGTLDCSTGYYDAFFPYAVTHRLSWVATAWYPGGCAYPSLITDWNGTPSVPGAAVRAHLH